MTQYQPLVADDPRRLGAFEIVGRLGEGGQGVVYLATGPTGEHVAVKLLHHALVADADARTRFLREVAVAQRVARFCTAPVLHADLEGSRPYIVTDYVPGPSLRQLVDREGPRRGAALERLAISTATALAAIHRAGILHRDFKPANVLMGPEGPVVIDFGIARALDSPGATATGMAMGTPAYLAPEQLSGAPVSEAADVFAWGVTMVFAATGKPAFGSDSIPVVMNRILNEEPQTGELDGVLGELVTACLSKDSALRPTADQLVAHLTGQLTNPVRRQPISGPQFAAPGQQAPGAQARHPQGPPVPGSQGPHGAGPGAFPNTQVPAPRSGSPKSRRTVAIAVSVAAAGAMVLGGTYVLAQSSGKTSTALVAAGSDKSAAPSDPGLAGQLDEPPIEPDLLPETPILEEHTPIGKPAKTRQPLIVVPQPTSAPITYPPSAKPSAKPTRKPTAKPTKSDNGDLVDPSPTDDPQNPPPGQPTSQPTSQLTKQPTVKPTVKPTAAPKPNPHSAAGVCGSGFKKIASRGLGKATVFLLYNARSGQNCVVTLSKYVVPGKIWMNAILRVKGGSSRSNPGRFTAYAGPVRLPAAKKCVIWGGSFGSASWKSGWSHCG